ncbi:hypothetical protein SDC9_145815 [bioreactor metagenome]|uniref:Uncharacterized protein n=1 Tax=bioreactor metagenome TaxID=1076179 RepID=A0A645E9M3_9ZZZZ
MKQIRSGQFLVFFNGNQRLVEFRRISDTVNAGNRGYNQNISSSGKQTCRCRKPKFFHFFINGQILFDISICGSDECFRLIIIVITHEILYRVFRKKLLELHKKLRRQSFVVCQNQSWFLHILHHICHGESFPGTGNSEQGLVFFAAFYAIRQFFNRLRLVAGWSVF